MSKAKCQMCGIECELTKHHLIPQVKCKNKYKEIKNEDSNIIIKFLDKVYINVPL